MSMSPIDPTQLNSLIGTTSPSSTTSANSSGSATSTNSSLSFATTLAKITSELNAIKVLSGNDKASSNSLGAENSSGSLFGSSPSSSGSDVSSLVSLLMSSEGGGSGGSTTEVSGLSPSTSSSLASEINALGSIASGGTSVSTSSINGAEVVAKAAQYVGTPYVWGGTSPKGFDCSGLTQYVYGQLGVSLPRTSEQQALAGTKVSDISQARPGDLVFFAGSDGTTSSPGHVGIYIGNGQMIDSPHTGTNVQIQSVANFGQVVAIRRVLPSQASAGNTMIGTVSVPNAYASTVISAAQANNIPPTLLAALIKQESGFSTGEVSSAGAVGIAQFMPTTAAGMGVNPTDPISSINGAATLIGSYVKHFGSYADALAAYNAGSAAVTKYGGIPPYAETRNYVTNILSMAGLSNEKGSVA